MIPEKGETDSYPEFDKGVGRGAVGDARSRARFTSAVVEAINELQCRKAPPSTDFGRRAYEKLQYDLPLVTPQELEGLANSLRASLQLKSSQPPFPVTSKLLENVVAGARASDGRSSSILPNSNGGAPTVATSESLPYSLVDANLLGSNQEACSSFRALCAVILVQLVAHSLAVSEEDTWGLLYAIGSDEEEDAEACQRENTSNIEAVDRTEGGSKGQLGPDARSASSSTCIAALGPRLDDAASNSYKFSAVPSAALHHGNNDQSAGPSTLGILEHLISCADNGPSREALDEQQRSAGVGNGEPHAAEEDDDNFVFEDIETPCRSIGASTAGTANRTCNPVLPAACSAPPPPYSWPALRTRLLRLAGHVSYALLDEPNLWSDGELLQGVFQLLRALGAHRHSQELQPLLHAYVGLVADRIAAEPSELACLDCLWDAVGLQCIASLPQVGRQRIGSGAGRRVDREEGLLLAEAITCLSLVATLARQLTGAYSKLRLWQQVHKHMLPLLVRCLGELARMVAPGRGQAAATKARSAGPPEHQADQGPRLECPGPEEVAVIVLVCEVLDFYVQERPGNADLVVALKGTGVLASLSVLFSAAGALQGAESLRSAALCCAASSPELHSWMLAVPGVAKTLADAPFHEGGPYEGHGAVWQLLSSGGCSVLARNILTGGEASEKASRVHTLLQLMDKAAVCRGLRSTDGRGLWDSALERCMLKLFVALRQEQATARGLAGRPGRAHVEGEELGLVTASVGGAGAGDGGACVSPNGALNQEDDDEDDDEEKLHLLEPGALQRRRARQLHPTCLRILKQLLTASGALNGKTD